jgi:hypothetical protein
MTIQGHNNKVYGTSGLGGVDDLVLMGHNNRFENLLVTGELVVQGHNNNFVGLRFA